jgi:hypothetical protein
MHEVLLELLQFRERVVGAKIQFPGVGRLLGNYIHANSFIRARGRVALSNDGEAIVAGDKAGIRPGVHRVHHDRAIIHRDVVEAGNDEDDLASLVELHLMYTRTRAQRRCSYKKEKEGKLSHVCEQPDSLVRFEGGKQSLLQININTIERGVTRPLLLYCKTGFRVPSTLPALHGNRIAAST